MLVSLAAIRGQLRWQRMVSLLAIRTTDVLGGNGTYLTRRSGTDAVGLHASGAPTAHVDSISVVEVPSWPRSEGLLVRLIKLLFN